MMSLPMTLYSDIIAGDDIITHDDVITDGAKVMK
jgi:hypothetical protein